mmetsp:Transcript_25907/g.64349  ORF Transcript_25907/g.64349 Transcript_25907/m.64349 type:complete len:329 (-) Transcript_25907:273-1259(-)
MRQGRARRPCGGARVEAVVVEIVDQAHEGAPQLCEGPLFFYRLVLTGDVCGALDKDGGDEVGESEDTDGDEAGEEEPHPRLRLNHLLHRLTPVVECHDPKQRLHRLHHGPEMVLHPPVPLVLPLVGLLSRDVLSVLQLQHAALPGVSALRIILVTELEAVPVHGGVCNHGRPEHRKDVQQQGSDESSPEEGLQAVRDAARQHPQLFEKCRVPEDPREPKRPEYTKDDQLPPRLCCVVLPATAVFAVDDPRDDPRRHRNEQYEEVDRVVSVGEEVLPAKCHQLECDLHNEAGQAAVLDDPKHVLPVAVLTPVFPRIFLVALTLGTLSPE